MSMSVLLVLTTVNNCVPTLQEDITVVVTVDMSCWLMDTSVKVLITMHSEPLLTVHKLLNMTTHTHAHTNTYTQTHSHPHPHTHTPHTHHTHT